MCADKKVAIITGAARGIGAATAQKFARQGYAVILLDVLEEGQEISRLINTEGGESFFFKCDVSDESQVRERVQWVGEQYGRIDALLNIAGIVLVKPFEEISWEEYQRTFDVNVGGTFLMCKYVLPFMKRQKHGVIVNMASVSGHVGQTDHVMYGATKGAIIAMARALAWEVAPYNIRVNTISPGSVDTPMLRGDIDLESRRSGLPFDEVKKIREAEQAFKRWADPAEIAEPIFYLASEGASFITGADLLVDCGWVAK
ncbi:MAG: SDR family oxidoreductase [Chloroflexi bacterium]|nr:SDR family oxidoreductase [Chloroflexota bacterium]